MFHLRRAAAAAVVFCAFWACALVAGSAHAYVRTRTDKSGLPVQWTAGCIVMQPDARGSQDVSLDVIETTLGRAESNWTSRTASCPGLDLSQHAPTKNLDPASDGYNAVVFRDTNWEHDPASIGLTTVVYIDSPGQIGDGVILDADIELNGEDYTFSTTPATSAARPGTMVIDLESTLTHELGHVQGLGHTCWDHVLPAPPVDENGNPIPDCGGPLPQSIIMTTMYPYYQGGGDTSKRNLSSDDVAGVCDVYSKIATHLACYPEVDGGCNTPPRPPRRWPLAAVAAILVAVVLARRRRRW